MQKLMIILFVIVLFVTGCAGDVIQADEPAAKPSDTMAVKVDTQPEPDTIPTIAPKPYDPWLQK